MTAKELATSFIEYHLKAQRELYAKKATSDFIKEEGQRIYGSFEGFAEHIKTGESSGTNVRITAKQATFLGTLMRKENIERVKFDGFHAWISNPSYQTAAYGGGIGKGTDYTKHILKIKKDA